MKSWFVELLTEDNLTLDSFVNSVKTYNLPGDYRHMLVKPWDVSWEVVGYDEPTEDLIVSGKERFDMSGELPPKAKNGKTSGHKYQALILNMSLPSSW